MKYYIFALVMLSIFTHFLFWGYPNQVVFDEVHFGAFSSSYLTGEYFFDIHPPLGKILISSFGRLGQANPSTTFSTIGNSFDNMGYLWLRFLPNLAGMLLPLVIFFLCLRLGFSKVASFFAGLFLILENSLLVQSRFILLDSFLLLFGFSGLLFYLVSRKQFVPKKKFTWLFLSVVFLTFSIAIKWTGLAYLGLVLLIEFIDWFKNYKQWRLFAYFYRFLFFVFIPFFVYFSIFSIHFYLLDKTGPGNAFMTPAFQKTLIGNPYENDESVEPEAEILKFVELNMVMYGSNQHLTATHPYSSCWYTWPFLWRPIFYWNQTSDDKSTEAKIYLLGNPLIYWLSFEAFLVLLMTALVRSIDYKKNRKIFLFLIVGYLANLLPYIFVSRVLFLYHYFASLVFAIISLVFVVDKITDQKIRLKKIVFICLTLLFLLSFLFIAPLTYGIPLSEGNWYQADWWPQNWR